MEKVILLREAFRRRLFSGEVKTEFRFGSRGESRRASAWRRYWKRTSCGMP